MQPQSEEEKKKLLSLPSYACQQDSDCELVVDGTWDRCSGLSDVCGPRDYSESKWVAVNRDWYYSQIDGCTGFECPEFNDDRYKSACVNYKCQKVEVSECCNLLEKAKGMSCYQIEADQALSNVAEHKKKLKTITTYHRLRNQQRQMNIEETIIHIDSVRII